MIHYHERLPRLTSDSASILADLARDSQPDAGAAEEAVDDMAAFGFPFNAPQVLTEEQTRDLRRFRSAAALPGPAVADDEAGGF